MKNNQYLKTVKRVSPTDNKINFKKEEITNIIEYYYN